MNINNLKRDKNGRFVIDEKLDNVEYLPTGNNSIKFFFGDNKRYFGKCDSFVSTSDYEIFASYLAEHIGLNAVKYYPSVFKVDGAEFNGVICEDFTQNNKHAKIKSSWFYKDSNLPNTIENQLMQIESYAYNLSKDQSKSYIFDKRKAQNELLKLLIFDFCLLQADRAPRNIEYLIKQNGENFEIELAPIFDNSAILCQENSVAKKKVIECLQNNNPLPENIFDNKTYLLGINNKMDIKGIAKEIKRLQLFNPYVKTMLTKLKNIDFEAVKDKIKQENPNYKLPDGICEMTKGIINQTLSYMYYERQNLKQF